MLLGIWCLDMLIGEIGLLMIKLIFCVDHKINYEPNENFYL